MIKVIDNWYIDSDGTQYILQEDSKKKTKKGEKRFKNQSYFKDLEGAFLSLKRKYEMKEIESKSLTLGEAIKEIRLNNERFEELLNKALKGSGK